MKRVLMLSILVFCHAALLSAADVSVLVQAERNFSKMAGEKGMRAAFLEFLADDSIVFQDGPVNGKKYYGSQPDSPGLLYWLPAVAELSVAGDLGYTTGPWEYHKKSKNEWPVAYGAFASIWKKQPDGRFKVAVDIGCVYPPSAKAVASLENAAIPPVPPGKKMKVKDREAEKKKLIQLDKDFNALYAEKGAVEAYSAFAIPGVRLEHDGSEPITAPDQVREALTKIGGALSWEPAAADVASSGDFGYTYGATTLVGNSGVSKGDYLRVWKRQPDGTWKAVLDVIGARK